MKIKKQKEQSMDKVVELGWGRYRLLDREDTNMIREWVLFADGATTMKRHEYQQVVWNVLLGELTVFLEDPEGNEYRYVLEKGDHVTIAPLWYYRIYNYDSKSARAVEVRTGKIDEGDVEYKK